MQDSQPADGDAPTPEPTPVPAPAATPAVDTSPDAPPPVQAEPAGASAEAEVEAPTLHDTPVDAPSAPAVSPAAADLSPAACAALLSEHFPALFGPGPRKPLKLRIQADIQQRQPGVYTRRTLSAFLHRHTTTTAYLIALTQAPHRFDLDGQGAGEISTEHREAAVAELARRREIHEGRRREEQRAAQAQAAERHATQAAEAQARQARAALLRAFETTTLTRANFLALKGLREDELEAQLTQAREERRLAPPAPPPRQPAPGRGPRPPQPAREGRGDRPPRRDGAPPGGKPRPR